MKIHKALLFSFILFAFSIFISSCGGNTTPEKGDKKDSLALGKDSLVQPTFEPDEIPAYKLTAEWKEHYQYSESETQRVPIPPPRIDLNQDLSGKTMEELWYLVNLIKAKRGVLLEDAVERSWFSWLDWYQPVFWEEDFKPAYLAGEKEFMDKCQLRMNELKASSLKEGYAIHSENIINFHQLEVSGSFKNDETRKSRMLEMLGKNGIAISETNNEQMFHVYDQNNYQEIGNFVTTDLFLQLLHIHFSYLLRDAEESDFIPALKDLIGTLTNESNKYLSSVDPEVKDAAEFNITYWGVAQTLLMGPKINVKGKYSSAYESETKSILAESGKGSQFLNDEFFDYTLFKPRGHYTRTEELKRYFKAMMWIQSAPLKFKDNEKISTAFRAAVLSAFFINSGQTVKGNQPLLSVYEKIYNPITYIAGEPNRATVMDISAWLKSNGITSPEAALKDENCSALQTNLDKLNRRKFGVAAADKMNDQLANQSAVAFMPQRYTFDSEILKRMVMNKRMDLKQNPLRPIPKGLDVFAALGNKTAENILTEVYAEVKKWPGFDDTLRVLKNKFAAFKDWDQNVYNKWMYAAKSLAVSDSRYPPFMKTEGWNRKSLNTALGTWTELKHDMILYAEQPVAAEMGGPGDFMPPPVVRGYVEPNVTFWQAGIDMLDKVESVFKKYQLSIPDAHNEVKTIAQKLLEISKKELSGTPLTKEDYEYIKYIGGDFEYLTARILKVGSWFEVQGPDKSIALAADVFTYSSDFFPSQVLEEAIGPANEIFVVHEINGRLVILHGAVFSYYEFTVPPEQRLTDEAWQERISRKEIPAQPAWMKPILLN